MKGEGRHLGQRLTAPDRAVMELVAAGFSNVEIAERLVYSRGSVENRVTRLYHFFGIEGRNRVRLAQAIEHHLKLEAIMGE